MHFVGEKGKKDQVGTKQGPSTRGNSQLKLRARNKDDRHSMPGQLKKCRPACHAGNQDNEKERDRNTRYPRPRCYPRRPRRAERRYNPGQSLWMNGDCGCGRHQLDAGIQRRATRILFREMDETYRGADDPRRGRRRNRLTGGAIRRKRTLIIYTYVRKITEGTC